MEPDLTCEQIRMLKPIRPRFCDRSTELIPWCILLWPVCERRMEVVEDKRSTRFQKFCRIRWRVIVALAPATAVQNQQVERPAPNNLTPVPLQHRDVGVLGKQGLSCRRAHGVLFDADNFCAIPGGLHDPREPDPVASSSFRNISSGPRTGKDLESFSVFGDA